MGKIYFTGLLSPKDMSGASNDGLARIADDGQHTGGR